MPINFGKDANSKPAVYNEKTTGVTSSDAGELLDVKQTLESLDVVDQLNAGEQASDTFGTAINFLSQTQTDEPIRVGTVLLAFPYVHCYKVQLSGRQGMCVATALSQGSLSPIGVKDGHTIAPGSSVLIWKPRDSHLSYILGVIPSPTTEDKMNPSDNIQQGGNSGPKKVEAYRHIVKTPTDAMGFFPQSSGRPMDGANGEYVKMSETGIGLLIDSFQAYLRVNEACGLFLNYFDNYAKLAALSLNISSYCETNLQLNDEGELFSFKGYATYPWETTGMYKDGTDFTKDNGEQIQLDKDMPFGLVDIKDYAQTPVFRVTEYTGYIGQGFNRTVMKPAKEDGVRKLTDPASDKDDGLFQQLISLDGSYSVRSAKQISFYKYPIIPNPRRARTNEDGLGDDKEYDGEYRFSGKFGTGDEHKVKDWDDSEETDNKPLLRVAGVVDLLSHHFNWKSTHPFHYHTKDYNYPDESEFDRKVKFMAGNFSQSYQNNNNTTKLKIDDRFGEVTYYNTASFFSMLEDGSIVIGDGYGSQITMTGGSIRLETGGDLILASGARAITLSKEAIIRTKDSIDISSSDEDVRIKAEKNLQMLGGNRGSGGVLIESKAGGLSQTYENKVGTEARGSGIMLLAKGGNVTTLTQNVYIRSGIGKKRETTGHIIVDAAKGKGSYISYARSNSMFNAQGLGIWHSPRGESPSIKEGHYIGPSAVLLNGPCLINKTTVVLKGFLGVEKGFFTGGFGIFGGRVGCLGAWPRIGDTKKIRGDIKASFEPLPPIFEKLRTIGTKVFTAVFPEFMYKKPFPGNKKIATEEVGFSFRDKTEIGGQVYGYGDENFFFLETRFQQLGRMGLVREGETWKEKPVKYQDKELFPWPGKKHWQDRDAFIRYENFELFETAGHAKDRGKDYEEPKFKALKKVKCNSGFKVTN